MWCQEKPTDVREKESTLCIMWIGVGLGIFMVNTMIVGPSVSIALFDGKKLFDFIKNQFYKTLDVSLERKLGFTTTCAS